MTRILKTLALAAVTTMVVSAASAQGQFTVHVPDAGNGISGVRVLVSMPAVFDGAPNAPSTSYKVYKSTQGGFCGAGIGDPSCGQCTNPTELDICKEQTILIGHTRLFEIVAGFGEMEWLIVWDKGELVANQIAYVGTGTSSVAVSYTAVPQDSER